MGVRWGIDWGEDNGKGERPGAVFAGYADLCEGLVAGRRARRMWEGKGEDVLFVRFVMAADNVWCGGEEGSSCSRR